MRLSRLLLALLFTAGCTASERRLPADGGKGNAIAVGQPWTDAEGVAARAGYRLHDAAGLAWQPSIDGFYVRLADDRDLIVFRDRTANVVGALTVVENASKPKSLRSHHSRQSFELPLRSGRDEETTGGGA